jgi:uncharacterized integral membrane protein
MKGSIDTTWVIIIAGFFIAILWAVWIVSHW